MPVAATAYNAIVEKMYIAYFGRPADPGGLSYYSNMLAAANAPTTSVGFIAALMGKTNPAVVSMVQAFAASPEATALYPSTQSINAQVALVYQYALGRTAEPAGIAYWANEIAAGRQTLATVAIVIMQAGENDPSVDGPSVAVRTSAALAFTSSVDLPAEISAYSGAAAAATARAWLLPVNGTTPGNNTQAVIDQTILAIQGVSPAGGTGGASGGSPGQGFNLLATADTFAGGPGNDTFTAATGTFGTGDNLDGGAGSDTLTITQTGNLSTAGTTVVNIETVNVSATGTLSVAATGWTGLTALNASTTSGNDATIAAPATAAITYTGQNIAAGNVTINGGSTVTATTTGDTSGMLTIGNTTAPTGAVVVNVGSNGATTMGGVTVTAGGNVSVTQTANNANNTTTTTGAVTINGGANTTSVTAVATARATASSTVAGVLNNAVSITDVNAGTLIAGKITSVTATNYTTLSIADTALTNLSVTGGSSNVVIDNSGLAAPTNRTLNVTANGVTGGTLDDADIYTTINFTTTGTNSTFANLTDGAMTTLTVSGTNGLTFTSAAGMSALTSVTVSGSAGLTANLATPGTVTSVSTAATTGSSTLFLNASQATFTGGAGIDKITLTSATVSKAVDLGAGDDFLTLAAGTGVPAATINGGLGTDTLTMDATSASTTNNSGSGAFAAKVSGFEKLVLTGATNQTVDLAALGNYTDVATSGGNGMTLTNFASGGTLTLTGAGTSYVIGNSAFTAGLSDTVNFKLTSGSGAGVGFATTGVIATNVENINVTTADTQAGGPTGTFNNTFALLGNSATSITVSGTAGLTLTATDTAATSVDASGITVGGFTFTSGNLAGPATVKGSATGTNTVDVSATSQAVTYVGGSGVDNVTFGAGANVVTGAGAADNFTFAAGASTASHLTTITDYRAAGGANAGAADIITITGITAVSSNLTTVQNLSAQGSLAAALDVMANAMTTSNGLGVFVYGGNEYVFVETSGASTSYAAADTVIKLTGVPFVAGTAIAGLGIDGV